jgi:hypothetical protein
MSRCSVQTKPGNGLFRAMVGDVSRETSPTIAIQGPV